VAKAAARRCHNRSACRRTSPGIGRPLGAADWQSNQGKAAGLAYTANEAISRHDRRDAVAGLPVGGAGRRGAGHALLRLDACGARLFCSGPMPDEALLRLTATVLPKATGAIHDRSDGDARRRGDRHQRAFRGPNLVIARPRPNRSCSTDLTFRKTFLRSPSCRCAGAAAERDRGRRIMVRCTPCSTHAARRSPRLRLTGACSTRRVRADAESFNSMTASSAALPHPVGVRRDRPHILTRSTSARWPTSRSTASTRSRASGVSLVCSRQTRRLHKCTCAPTTAHAARRAAGASTGGRRRQLRKWSIRSVPGPIVMLHEHGPSSVPAAIAGRQGLGRGRPRHNQRVAVERAGAGVAA